MIHERLHRFLLALMFLSILQGPALCAEQEQYAESVALRQRTSEETLITATQQGLRKYRSGDYAGALEAYQATTTNSPEYAHAWTMIGHAHMKLKNALAARESFSKAILADPDGEADNHYYVGMIEESFGRGPQAYYHYQLYLSLRHQGLEENTVHKRAQRLVRNITDVRNMPSNATSASDSRAEYLIEMGAFHQAKCNSDFSEKGSAHLEAAIRDYRAAVAFASDLEQVAQYRSALDIALALKAKRMQ